MDSTPNDFLCPITCEIMQSPVICADGHSYEESAILEWFKRSDRSPKTGLPLANKTLIPNIALRNAIQDWSVVDPIYAKENAAPVVQLAKVLEPLAVEYATSVSNVNYMITKSDAKTRAPKHLICAVDVSRSMNTLCLLGQEDNGFSRLDLVKHSLRMISAALDPADKITLVTFSRTANKVFSGHKSALLDQIINSLQPDGCTEIWDALVLCFNTAIAEKTMDSSVLLLTDGLPQGKLDTQGILRAYSRDEKYQQIPLTAVGYGYELDFNLLSSLTKTPRSRFLFIPDISMVGTIFVHYLANVLTEHKDSVKLSNYVISKSDSKGIRALTAEETYSTVLLQFAEFVSEVRTTKNLDLCRLALNTFKDYPELVQEIQSQELHQGQITKALSPSNYQKWGRFYLEMLASAHTNQECYNFKDSSIQSYGGPIFKKYVADFDALYNSIPAPKPSQVTHRTTYVSSMSSLNRVDNGCFDGDSQVRYLDFQNGTAQIKTKKVSDIQKGDYVYTGSADTFAVVCCLVRSSVFVEQKMYNWSGVWITPWHPVKLAPNKPWQFPADTFPDKSYLPYKGPYIYNLVLEKNHQVLLNDSFIAVTLGHYIQDDPVASHKYFGTDEVIQDLLAIPGYSDGFIDLDGYSFTRDTRTNLINGLIPKVHASS